MGPIRPKQLRQESATPGQALVWNGTEWAPGAALGGALAGLPGNLYESLVFYVDPADRNSYVGSGTAVTDILGNATAGTLSGATPFAAGNFNFDGASGQLTFTKNANIDDIFAGGGSLFAFIRPSSSGEAGAGRIVDTTDNADEGWYLSANGQVGGRMRFRFQRNFTTTTGADWTLQNDESTLERKPLSVGGVRAIPLGQWTSIGLTYDDTLLTNDPTGYVDGNIRTVGTDLGLDENQAPAGVPISDAGNPIAIGNNSGDATTWNGQIGPVLLFDRVLTRQEMQHLHNWFGARYGLGAHGLDSTTGLGQSVAIQGGEGLSSGGDQIGNGGDLILAAGDNNQLSFAGGGNVLIRGGDKTVGQGATGSGSVTIRSGGSSGLSSTLSMFAGDLNSGNSGVANSVFIHGTDNTSTGFPGGVEIRGGNASSSNRSGGDLSLTGGLAQGSGTGGDVDIRGGVLTAGSTGGRTGSVLISTSPNGTGGTLTATGAISLTTTGGGATARSSGQMLLSTGNYANNGSIPSANSTRIDIFAGSDAGGAAVHDQGAINIVAGNKAGGGRAGPVNITSGTNTGTGGGGASGAITITSGSITNGGATAPVGNISLILGTQAGSGSTGRLIFDYATWPGADGGAGDVLTTDGAGVLSWAAASGSGALQAAYVAGNTIVTDLANGDLDVSGTEAISLDASKTSNFTVTGPSADLNLSTGDTTIAGDVNILAGGSSTAATVGGGVSVTGGVGGTNAAGGIVSVRGGAGSGAGLGGPVQLRGGAGGATSSAGGIALVIGGAGGDSGGGGTDGPGGNALVIGGTGLTTALGGFAKLQGGSCGGSATISGAAIVEGGSSTNGQGGPAQVVGGAGGGSNGLGGHAEITGGAGTGTAFGGNFVAAGGAGGATGIGGSATVTGGAGGGNATGGIATVQAGAGAGTANGGNAQLRGGAGGSSGATGGFAAVSGGTAGTGGDGGAAALNGNIGVNGGSATVNGGQGTTAGGVAVLRGGNGATSGVGGDATVEAGDGGSSSGAAGSAFVTGGDSVNLPGGDASLSGGASTSSVGGDANITAGDSGTGFGGAVRINGGDTASTVGTTNAGDLVLTGGTQSHVTGGRGGNIDLFPGTTTNPGSPSGTIRLLGDTQHTGTNLGFYGTTAIAKPAVTGSRGGNAALASLLTQLAALGLITDSTVV